MAVGHDYGDVIACGPWASVGVQLNAPPAVMLAPAGAPAPRLKVRVFAGTSASVAVAVNDRSASSLTDCCRSRKNRRDVDLVYGDAERLGVGAAVSVGNDHGDVVVPGPGPRSGVKVNAPPAVMLAPAGAPARG